MKIGVICSPGGHLSQALSLMEAFRGNDCFLITKDLPNVKDFKSSSFREVYFFKIFFQKGLSTRMPLKLYVWFRVLVAFAGNIPRLIRIFSREKPDVLFSTGSEIAIPAFYVGKFLFGTKVIFLDSITRIKDISVTGKFVMPIADLFLVQWEELAQKYKKAVFHGRLI